jgi:putative transposase
MCKIANVSKSGYYYWLNNLEKNRIKEQEDFLTINKIFNDKKQKAGFRTIKMELLKEGINMNHKKIIRIMKKNNLQTKIRRKNPYKMAMKITLENTVFPNVLNREFKPKAPYLVYSTDITYLNYGQEKTAYLSAIKDIASGEIIAHTLSKTMKQEFVLTMLKKAIELTPVEKLKGLKIHSDKGAQYRSEDYQKILKAEKIIQSMSAAGTPLDNAPIESFFGHFKDEIDYKNCKTFEELEEKINKYMYNYNNNRKQWSKKKMTPIEYKQYLLAS